MEMTRGVGKASPKETRKKAIGKNQSCVNGVPSTGKKRKKKGGKDVPPLPLQRSAVAPGENCSSNSSLDTKPSLKQGRFECSSSEKMSSDHTSSSAMMDTGTISPPHPLTTHLSHCHPLTVHSAHHHTPTAHTPCAPISTSISTSTQLSGVGETTLSSERSHDTTSSTDRSHDSDTISHDVVHELAPRATDHPLRPDTDRWRHVCLDEEQEKLRLEVYKENRRKRYESALEKKLSLLPRTDYYSTDSH